MITKNKKEYSGYLDCLDDLPFDVDVVINTLHIDYFYNGNYPENYEEEFEKWHEKVEDFVRRLEGMKK